MDGIRYWIETEGSGHWFFLAFPICLLMLFIWFKGRWVRFLIPSFLISLVIINPWFYKVWEKLGLYAYWRILWIVPVIPVMAALIPSISERIQQGWVKVIVATAGVGLIVFSGTFLYNGAGGSFVEAANAAKLPNYVVQIADKLLEFDDHPRVIAQDPVGVYLRQYSGSINTLYGRDLYGHISYPNNDAKRMNGILSNPDGDMNTISQFMLDEGYDYLIYGGEAGEGFEQVASVENYGIYKVTGIPAVEKERNELGQVVSITTLDSEGKPTNGRDGCETVRYEYDEYSNVTLEFHTDTDGNGVADENGIAGFRRVYDNDRMISETTLGADGAPCINVQGYAEVRREYKDGRLVREAFLDEHGNAVMTTLGYSSFVQEYDGDRLVSRSYLDEAGNPVNRTGGYAKVMWLQGDAGTTNIHFYDTDGAEIEIEGLNLVNGLELQQTGWSEWITPQRDVENQIITIGSVNLGEKQAGDIYTCQLEIEFFDVSASDPEKFRFWTLGTTDGTWGYGNVWNENLVYLDTPPEDGVYRYISSCTLNETLAGLSTFSIAFRCDHWESGSFRVRSVMIEKGNEASAWSPGL